MLNIIMGELKLKLQLANLTLSVVLSNNINLK